MYYLQLFLIRVSFYIEAEGVGFSIEIRNPFITQRSVSNQLFSI
jgi:hypothetical protein